MQAPSARCMTGGVARLPVPDASVRGGWGGGGAIAVYLLDVPGEKFHPLNCTHVDPVVSRLVKPCEQDRVPRKCPSVYIIY